MGALEICSRRGWRCGLCGDQSLFPFLFFLLSFPSSCPSDLSIRSEVSNLMLNRSASTWAGGEKSVRSTEYFSDIERKILQQTTWLCRQSVNKRQTFCNRFSFFLAGWYEIQILGIGLFLVLVKIFEVVT